MLQAKSIRILLGFVLLFSAVQYGTKSVSGKVQIQVLATSLETPTTIDSSGLAQGLENDTADSTSNATLKHYQPVLPTDELPRWTHRGAVDAKKVEKNQQSLSGFAAVVVLPFLAFNPSYPTALYTSKGHCYIDYKTQSLPYRRGPPCVELC